MSKIFNLRMIVVVIILHYNSTQIHSSPLSHQPWPKQLMGLYHKLHQDSNKNYLIVVSRSPTHVLDLRSENNFRDSIARPGFARTFHPGHFMIGWTCRLNNFKTSMFTGFTGDSGDANQVSATSMAKLAMNGFGLTALMAEYTDGQLETANQIQKYFDEIEDLKKTNSPKFENYRLQATVIEISQNDCRAVVKQFDTFLNSTKARSTYGLGLFPEFLEGASCNSFVVHLLSQVVALQKVTAKFRRQFRFPSYLAALPAKLPLNVNVSEKLLNLAEKTPVSTRKLSTSDWTTSEEFQHLDFQTIDSELIIFWQNEISEHALRNDVEPLNVTNEVLKTVRPRRFWQTITDAFDNGRQSRKLIIIDKDFDSHTQHIHHLNNQIMKDYIFRSDHFLGFPIAIAMLK